MLKRLGNLAKQNSGMTLVEVLTAMTLLALMIFCFAPLFLSYFNSITIAGDKIQSVYEDSGEMQQVINNVKEGAVSRYTGYYSGNFNNIMTVKSKETANAVSITTTGKFLGNDPLALYNSDFQNGYVTIKANYEDTRIQCFPSTITDDFKEKYITIVNVGGSFDSANYGSTASYKLSVTNSDGSLTTLTYGKEYNLIHYAGAKNMLLLTLRGGSNICFEKSPLVFNYNNGEYIKKIQIDAPTAIMVGEQAKDGGYYYYVTRGHVDNTGSLEIIQKSMTDAPLTSAMNDVTWVPAESSDGYKDTDTAGDPKLKDDEKYGYYIMCGDNGEIRRFWRDEATGNYYWGGDYTYDTDIKFETNGENYIHGTIKKDTSTSYAFSSFGDQTGTKQKGFNLAAVLNKGYLQCLSSWTVTSAGPHYYYASDGKIYHMQSKSEYKPDYVLPYSIVSEIGSNTKKSITYAGFTGDYYLENWDNLSNRSTYNYGHEDMTWLVENSSGSSSENPITLTCADAIVINTPNYTNPAKDSYQITDSSKLSEGLSYPTKTYNLYCGYIPAVMDVWSASSSASTSMENAVVAQESNSEFSGQFYNISAKGNLKRKNSNFGDSLTQMYARWRGTFGIVPVFTSGNSGAVDDSGSMAYSLEAAKTDVYIFGQLVSKNWKYHRIYVYYYPYTNIDYEFTGKVGDSTSELGDSLAQRLCSTFDGKQNYITNGKVLDITSAYLSHPLAVHIAANPSDDAGFDYSNDKKNHIHYWNNRRETVTYLDCASTYIPSGENDIPVSLMVGYVMGGLTEYDEKDMYVNTIMHNGIVMLRAGTADIDQNYSPNNGTQEYYAKDQLGYTLSQESNVFHQFYYLNSRTKSSEGKDPFRGAENHVGDLFGANYWENNRHINYVSLNGGVPDDPSKTNTGNYNYLRCHPMSNTKVNCVEWGVTWDDNPEAMWGTENGTLLSWDVDIDEVKNKTTSDPNWNDRSVDAEFQSYKWILNVSGVGAEEGKLGEAKTFAIEGKAIAGHDNYKETIGAHQGEKNDWAAQKFILSSKTDTTPEVYMGFYDKWTRLSGIWRSAGFISVLETINDIEFSDDIWVAAGNQSGQDPATFCPSGTTQGKVTVKPYIDSEGDGKGGSWINVRMWYDVKGTGKYIQYDSSGKVVEGSENTQYYWSAVQISPKENYNIQQINCINGIWMATGYVDSIKNGVYDDGEKTVVCWTRDPSKPCGVPGGWTENVTFWKYTGDGDDGFDTLSTSVVGGINSVAAR